MESTLLLSHYCKYDQFDCETNIIKHLKGTIIFPPTVYGFFLKEKRKSAKNKSLLRALMAKTELLNLKSVKESTQNIDNI